MKKLIFIILISFNIYSQRSEIFDPIDIFDLEYVSNPQISPDGNLVLYQRNSKDIMTDKNYSSIWIIDFDGSNNRPITTGNKKDSSPIWSNTGDKFIFKSDRDGKTQIYLYDLKNNSTQKLTNLQSSIGSIKWSPDDKFILFTSFVPEEKKKLVKMPKKPKGAKWNDPPVEISDVNYKYDSSGFRKPGVNQIFILPVEGGTPRQVSNLNKNGAQAQWISNNSIVFSANLHEDSELNPNNSEIYLLDISSGKHTALTDRIGPDFSPIVSNDKTKIAYLGYDDEYLGYQQNSIYIMNIDGTNKVKLPTDLDRNISNINWSGDDKEIFFQYDDKGMTKLAYTSLKGKILDVIVDLRKKSSTYGKHEKVILSGDNKKQFFIPRGFAHAFLVLSKTAIISYKVDNYYSPEHERGIAFDDEKLKINWQIKSEMLTLSNKDLNYPTLVNVTDLFD